MPAKTASGKPENASSIANTNQEKSVLQEMKVAVERMLRYASTNSDIDLPNDIIKEIANSGILKKDIKLYTANDEITLWITHSKLANLIKPATDASIQISESLKLSALSTNSNLLSSERIAASCRTELRLVKRFLIVFIILYVLTQCYIYLLSDNIVTSDNLISQLNEVQKSEFLITDKTAKSETDKLTQARELLTFQLQAKLNFFRVLNPFIELNTNDKEIIKKISFEREFASATYSVLSRYILPLLLGFVGATAYIARRTLNKLSTNSYLPSPVGMVTMRICLGGLLGAISGIFVSAFESQIQGFNIPLTVIALASGYSIEVAFSLFDFSIESIRNKLKKTDGNESSK